MRMRKELWMFLLLITATLVSQAQYAGYKPLTGVEEFKKQFAQNAQKLSSIRSDFTQEKNLSMLSEKIVSKGKFWYKKDNLVRMEYTHPFRYLLIINKNNVFIKDGQKENKISTRSNKMFQQINQLMVDCVKGTALNSPDFKSRVFENSQSCLVELTPLSKGLKELFRNINIIIDKKSFTVNRIDMQEMSGDNTMINFVNKELNVIIADALFTLH
jgi:outer membrane lipoprotein-sorting protein